jgi:IS30 family transposase
MAEEWVTLTEAAKRLKVAKSTVSRIAKRNNIPTKPDTVDTRILLVEYTQLHQLMSSSVKYQQDDADEAEE